MLSPSLFNILVKSIVAIKLPPTTYVLAYADDLAIVSYGLHPTIYLQRTLDDISAVTQKTGMFFLAAKTKTMTFFSLKPNSFMLGRDHLESVASCKYLGLIIDSKLSFAQHIKTLKTKLTTRFNILKIISNLKRGITTRHLITLYKALIQSIILYAIPTWLILPPTQIKSIEKSQSLILCYIMGVPPTTHNQITF